MDTFFKKLPENSQNTIKYNKIILEFSPGSVPGTLEIIIIQVIRARISAGILERSPARNFRAQRTLEQKKIQIYFKNIFKIDLWGILKRTLESRSTSWSCFKETHEEVPKEIHEGFI